MWTHVNKSFNKAYQELADAYMAENPDVTIELETFDYDSYIQTLQTSLPAGNEADILQMFGSWTCSYADNLSTVPEDVLSLADAEDAFFPGPLGGYECDDQLYGMPQESNVEYGATLVNTAMAEDAGCRARRLGLLRRVQGGRQDDDRDRGRRDHPGRLPLHHQRRDLLHASCR